MVIRVSAQTPPLQFVYAQGYPPFSWQDEEGLHGILLDFVDALVKDSLGLPVEHEILPWARCQMLVEAGEKDAIFTIPTPQREEYTLITDIPIYTSDYLIWTGATNPKMESIQEVTSLDILAEKEELINTYILGGGWHTKHLGEMARKSVEVNSTDILRLLALNRADIYIEQEVLVRYQMSESDYGKDILMIPNIIDETAWHIMFSKNSESSDIVISSLNKLLHSMRQSGDLEVLRRKIYSNYFST